MCEACRQHVCDVVQKAMLSSRVNHLVLLAWLQPCPFPCNSVNVKLADSGGVCACVCSKTSQALSLGSLTHFGHRTARFCLFKSFRTICPWANRSVHATGGSKQVQTSPFTRASSVCEWAGNRNTFFRFSNTDNVNWKGSVGLQKHYPGHVVLYLRNKVQ